MAVRAATGWRSVIKVPAGFVHVAGSFLAAAALWELTARFLVSSPIFFVSLGAIFDKAVELWRAGDLQRDISVSGIEFGSGFALATVIGILTGVGLAASRVARRFFEPWISMLYATPIIALGPLFILALGIGVSSKIAIIFLTAVFPIIINTVTGLTTTDAHLIEAARPFGASGTQIQAKVRVPAALPLGQPARTLLGEVEHASRRFLPRLGACLYRVQRIPTIPVSAPEWRRIWSAYRARRAPAPA